jgi:hypothetical protein
MVAANHADNKSHSIDISGGGTHDEIQADQHIADAGDRGASCSPLRNANVRPKVW